MGVRGRAGCAIAVAGGVLAACGGGAVEVPVPEPDAATGRACATLHDRLPDRVVGQERGTTSQTSDLVAVWGSPPIALRCGVDRPSGLHPTAQLAVVNGVSWLPDPPEDPVRYTAVGRRAYVEVNVPKRYSPQGEVLVQLSGPIGRSLPAKPDGQL